MTNPTQDNLDYVARLNGFTGWTEAGGVADGRRIRAMRLHALDRDKWLAEKAELETKLVAFNPKPSARPERQPVNWQDNMDFEPSEGAFARAVDWESDGTLNIARLIDHLQGTAPVKVDRDREVARALFNQAVICPERFEDFFAKLKELTNE